MTIYTVILYFFILLAAASAIAMAFSKNVFYSAIYVIICLLSIAGIYVLSFAEFLAVTQILVYAGGVLVIIIFGIMLTAKMGGRPLRVDHGNVLTGLLLVVPLFGVLYTAITAMNIEQPTATPLERNPGNIQTLGIGFMSDYVLAFEVAGILLLMALIGAAVIASHKPKAGI